MPDPLHELPGPDFQLPELEAQLDQARESDRIDPLPESRVSFDALPANQPGMVLVLRDRLFRLGYLSTNNKKAKIDQPLRRAILKFQTETAQTPGVGLTADGWVGEQTWQALQELFAFEPDSNLDRWLIGDQPGRVLCRAIRLRLSVLGLASIGVANPSPVTPLLNHWRDLLGQLGIPVEGIDGQHNQRLVSAMFDLDWLTTTIAKRSRSIYGRYNNMTVKAHRKAAERFLNCLTQIELWLLGFSGVKPNGRAGVIRAGSRRANPNRPGSRKPSGMYRDMSELWALTNTRVRRTASTCWMLLRTLESASMLLADDTDSSAQRADKILAEIQDNKEGIQGVWQKIGHRIWDGIKRIGRFILKFFRRITSTVIDAVKALARAARYLATQAASLVKRGIRIFSDSVKLLFSENWPGSNEWIAMHHDRDMDFLVYLKRGAPQDIVDAFFHNTRRLLYSFRAATTVLSIILRIGMAISKGLLANPWSWWSTIRTLIGVYRDLRKLKDWKQQEILLRGPLPV